MAKKGGSSYPAAPDPNVTAAAQAAANKETAITQARLNQINEITPFGTATYSPTGQSADGVDLYQREITLSPEQQAIANLEQANTTQLLTAGGQQIGRINDIISQPFDFSGAPPPAEADAAARQQVQDALFGRAKAQLDPLYAQQQRDLETQLVNSGFSRGSEGYTTALDDFSRNRSNAYEAALQDAIAGGGSEQSRLFGLQNAARQQAIQEQTLQRGQPINELATLLGTSGGISVPQFSGVPQVGVAPTDVVGPINTQYASQVNAYNQQQQQSQGLLGSIFGLAGTALKGWLSDPDAKTDKRQISDAKVLKKVESLPVEAWRYKGASDRRIGPYADDWADRFGGDGHTIESPVAFGVTLSAIKALADRVNNLEKA